MSQPSLTELLAEIHAREPRPQINVTLTNGNRLTLDDWDAAGDCLVERWPDGNTRYLVPFARVVLVEIPEHR